MQFRLNVLLASVLLAVPQAKTAAQTGGFATTAGGDAASAREFTATTFEEINTLIANARYDDAGKKVATGAYPLHITYIGNEDAARRSVWMARRAATSPVAVRSPSTTTCTRT
jgi:pectate lyase